MALIDSNNFIAHLVWSGIVDNATCGELKEAIELCTVKDIYTKADMVAMLTDIQLDIEKHTMISGVTNQGTWNECIACCSRVIQYKINSLKEVSDGDK